MIEKHSKKVKQKTFMVGAGIAGVPMLLDTILLYAVIVVSGIYASDERYWEIALPITTIGMLLAQLFPML